MFGMKELKRMLVKQGIIGQMREHIYGRYRAAPAVNVLELAAKVDLLLERESLELEQVEEHYELRESD